MKQGILVLKILTALASVGCLAVCVKILIINYADPLSAAVSNFILAILYGFIFWALIHVKGDADDITR